MNDPALLALVVVAPPDRRPSTPTGWSVVVVEHEGPGGGPDHGSIVAEHDGVDADVVAERLWAIEARRHPRWVWWGHGTATAVARLGLPLARVWDLAAVHRLLHGTWRSDPARIWAAAHDLDTDTIPEPRPDDLFHAFDERDVDDPVDANGHLTAEWARGAWADTSPRRRRWAQLALTVQARQADGAGSLTDRPATASTIRAESAASLLAAELQVRGLPFDAEVAASIIGDIVGPRAAGEAEALAQITARDHLVLRHVPGGHGYDLRSPEQVRSMLRRCGIEVPDTRSWRLERLVDEHPVVRPLLEWRRAERVSTTFGYRWLDEHVVRVGGHTRLVGDWSSSDGAAGRMTASAGLHNMPAELRPAVVADPGHVFVRADLGQIEPRILAAVAGDEALARATHDDDLYAPVAARLGVPRDVAKVAVLGAMYGQTTGVGAAALRGLERSYPVAMAFLSAADRAAQGGHDLRTHGGRLVRLSAAGDTALASADARSRAAARGRYGRNAMVQGAAAEFFKMWAVLVRARGGEIPAHIVLCLHDELLVHVPERCADDAVDVIDAALCETADRWLPRPGPDVRFVADGVVVRRWSDVE